MFAQSSVVIRMFYCPLVGLHLPRVVSSVYQVAYFRDRRY
jgi:hypothetical protein